MVTRSEMRSVVPMEMPVPSVPENLPLSLHPDAEPVLFPGFCDVHVHLREPGFSYKETMASGTMAAAAGGFTDVCAMPNLNPVPDCASAVEEEQERIRADAVIRVSPYGALTVGEKGEHLADLAGMAGSVIAFSDDGKGVQDAGLMREAMEEAAGLGKLIAAHCEVNSLLNGGYIHAGSYAAAHGHKGIVSESEWRMIERDLRLADLTGCAYHVCHISCRESAALIREAKESGVNVTCETAPHYLVLDETYLQEDGRFKMNPPLRSRRDRFALLDALGDGTIDLIATDHAPHSAEEKSKGLEGSAFGIVGLETAFPILYSALVLRDRLLSLEELIRILAWKPRTRFGLAPEADSYTVWDLAESYAVDPEKFQSAGRATPFAGMKVSGRCLLTVFQNTPVYRFNADQQR